MMTSQRTRWCVDFAGDQIKRMPDEADAQNLRLPGGTVARSAWRQMEVRHSRTLEGPPAELRRAEAIDSGPQRQGVDGTPQRARSARLSDTRGEPELRSATTAPLRP